MKFSTVILTGGQSRRMGCDKAFLGWQGRSLLAHQIQTVQLLKPEEIFISGRPDADYHVFDCPILYDFFPNQGPLAGIEQALRSIHWPLLLVLAVDMPAMSAAFLQKLFKNCKENKGVLPELDGHLQPLAAFYPKAAHASALTMLQQGHNSVTDLADLCVKSRLLDLFPVSRRDRDCFFNWNLPSDFIDTKLCASFCSLI